MRKIVLGIFFSLIAICSFAKGSSDKDSPIQSFKYRHNLYGEVYLSSDDGGEVDYKSVEDVWHEKEGWTYIEGYGKLHLWLYDLSSGAVKLLLNEVIPEWVEEKGYVIDHEHFTAIEGTTWSEVWSEICPELEGLDAVPLSVQRLMDDRHSHAAVALITSDAPYPTIPLEYQSLYIYTHPYLLVYFDSAVGGKAAKLTNGKSSGKFYTFFYPLY